MLKLIINLGSNLAALLAAEYLIEGFEVTNDWLGLAIVVVMFTIANSLILPMVRMILKPLIWLTMGLLGVALNGILIFFIDKLSDGITISGLTALLLGTLVIGVVNATIAYGARVFK